MKTFALLFLTLFAVALPADEEHGIETKIEATGENAPVAAAEKSDDAPTDSDRDSSDNEVVSVGHDVSLAAGEKASQVVAVLGNVESAGEVLDNVVAVLGNV